MSTTKLDSLDKAIKKLPSVTLTTSDSSTTKPNESKVQLHGDHNTISMQSTSSMRRKTDFGIIALAITLFANIISCAYVYFMYDYTINRADTIAAIQHEQLLQQAQSYADNMAAKVNDNTSVLIKDSLSKYTSIAQEGNRNIIRIQLLKEFDKYLIDDETIIKRRDLDGLIDMYNYYISIDGNHDIPPRCFQFNQLIAKKQITVVD